MSHVEVPGRGPRQSLGTTRHQESAASGHRATQRGGGVDALTPSCSDARLVTETRVDAQLDPEPAIWLATAVAADLESSALSATVDRRVRLNDLIRILDVVCEASSPEPSPSRRLDAAW
jgi:hypothetical protein